MKKLILLYALNLVGSTVIQSRADVLFSTLNQTNFNQYQPTSTDWRLATDFLTGASTSTVTDVYQMLQNTDTVAHNFTVSIYTDAANLPGSLVGSFSTLSLGAGASGSVHGVSAGINLAANTPYWEVIQMNENPVDGFPRMVEVDDTDATDAGSIFSTIPSTPPEFSVSDGASWTSAGDTHLNMLFQLAGTQAVPEPSTLAAPALVLLVLFGATLRRRRARG